MDDFEFEVQLPPEPIRDTAEEHVPTMTELETSAALQYDPKNRAVSVIFNGETTSSELTQDWIESYCYSPQGDKEKTLAIIRMLRGLVNRQDIIGCVKEALENNISTRYRLSWRKAKNKDASKEELEKAKLVIAELLEKIDVPSLIRFVVPMTYQDGNCILYMKEQGKPMGSELLPQITVDQYPIGLAEISNYTIGYADPAVVVDINELKGKIRKTYTKKKNRKPIFYGTELEEVSRTFPIEIVKAYKESERYARLDIQRTGVLRLNTQGLQYGLSPLFRSLEAVVMLDSLARADRATTKVRTKKILAQYMNKETLGPNWDRDTFKQMAYAHKNLLEAWSNPMVLVTPPPTVKGIEYVEPKTALTDTETVAHYRNQIMATLGVSFLNITGTSSMTASNISVKQLLKEVDKITNQLEAVLGKWFKVVLQEVGINPDLAPSIVIIDSEEMEMGLKKEMADFMLNKLNASYESAFEVLGLNVEDEVERREAENERNLGDVFTPHLTAYNYSPNAVGDTEEDTGRPADENPDDPDKQMMDRENNKTKGGS